MTDTAPCKLCGEPGVKIEWFNGKKTRYIYHCSNQDCAAWMITGRKKRSTLEKALQDWNKKQEGE